MFVRSCAVMLIMSGACAIPRDARAQQRDACATAIPSNIDAGVFTRDVIELLSLSDTFRSQCERVAGAARVRVTLAIVTSLNGGRAQTAIHRFPSGAILAEVEVLFGENYRELLAHEFEHILEQIEGVDLRQEAANGRAWLLPDGAFETRRAYVTGVQVRTESEQVRVRATGPVAYR